MNMHGSLQQQIQARSVSGCHSRYAPPVLQYPYPLIYPVFTSSCSKLRTREMSGCPTAVGFARHCWYAMTLEQVIE